MPAYNVTYLGNLAELDLNGTYTPTVVDPDTQKEKPAGTLAYRIYDDGFIVGASRDEHFHQVAVYWDLDRSMHRLIPGDLTSPYGYATKSVAFAAALVNGNRWIAGGPDIVAYPPTAPAFLGHMSVNGFDPRPLNKSTVGIARGIGADQEIIVGQEQLAVMVDPRFGGTPSSIGTWNQTAACWELASGAPLKMSRGYSAAAINKFGVIVGQATPTAACLWRARDQQPESLPFSAESKGSNALDVNDHGIVVGTYGNFLQGTTPSDKQYPCIWDATSGAVRVSDDYFVSWSACGYGLVSGVNNSGTIVGRYSKDDNLAATYAFICSPGGQEFWHDLNDLVQPGWSGPGDQPWTLTEARSINSKGEILAIGAPGGAMGLPHRSFLLTPIVLEPHSRDYPWPPYPIQIPDPAPRGWQRVLVGSARRAARVVRRMFFRSR